MHQREKRDKPEKRKNSKNSHLKKKQKQFIKNEDEIKQFHDDHKGRTEINSKEDIIQHFKYGKGTTVNAGPKLFKQIRRCYTLEYIFFHKAILPEFIVEIDPPFPIDTYISIQKNSCSYNFDDGEFGCQTPKGLVIRCFCDILGYFDVHLDMKASVYLQRRPIFKTHIYGYKEINLNEEEGNKKIKGTPFLVKIDFTFNVGVTSQYYSIPWDIFEELYEK